MIRNKLDSFITQVENKDVQEALENNLDLIIITLFVVIEWGIFRAIIHFTARSQLYNVYEIHYTTFSPEINLYHLKKYKILADIILYLAIFAIAKRID